MSFGVIILFLSLLLIPNIMHTTLILVGYIKGRGDLGTFALEGLSVTVILPTRNEDLIIEQKLDDIEQMISGIENCNVRIYDCSEDKTSSIIEDFIDRKKMGANWSLAKNCLKGKSNTVHRAINEVDSDIIVFTDADALIEKDSFQALLDGISGEMVGAACGVNKGDRSIYRIISNFIRASESNLGASVIFEGSICAFKMSELSLDSIDVNRNADDSQLAISAQKNGKSAIFIRECKFHDMAEVVNSSIRKERRAQGLVRHLNSSIFDSRNSLLIRLLAAFNLHLLTIVPILCLAIFSIALGIHSSFIDDDIFSNDLLIAIMLLSGSGITITARGGITVYSSILKIILGRDLSSWNPQRRSLD